MSLLPKVLPDYELLHELFEVEENGTIIFLPREPKYWTNVKKSNPERLCEIWNNKYAFTESFTTLGAHGYYQGKILNELYLKHRIIFKMFYGYDPRFIDHINGNKLDNRIENLRDCSREENLKNQSLYINNISGHQGIFPNPRAVNKKWRVSIGYENKQINLGSYCTLEEAVKIRQESELKYGYHKNHGRSKITVDSESETL